MIAFILIIGNVINLFITFLTTTGKLANAQNRLTKRLTKKGRVFFICSVLYIGMIDLIAIPYVVQQYCSGVIVTATSSDVIVYVYNDPVGNQASPWYSANWVQMSSPMMISAGQQDTRSGQYGYKKVIIARTGLFLAGPPTAVWVTTV